MKTIGRHLIAEYYGCDQVILDDVDRVRGAMLRAAEIIGAHVLGEMFHTFEPHGVSGSVVIAESHLSIHTWPENGYVAVDIYTCGGLDPHPGFQLIAEELRAQSHRLQEIVRGLPEELEGSETFQPDQVQIISRTRPVQTFTALEGIAS